MRKDTLPGLLVWPYLAAMSLSSLVVSSTRIRFPGCWLTTTTTVTLVAGATDVHQSISLELNLGVGTLTAVDVEGCAFATPTNGGAVAASCSVSGLAVGVIDGTATTSTVSSVYTTMATLVPVQVPDSGAGAIPSGAATASTPKGTGGSSDGSSPTSTSTKNGASKGGVNWGIVVPAGLFIFQASFM